MIEPNCTGSTGSGGRQRVHDAGVRQQLGAPSRRTVERDRPTRGRHLPVLDELHLGVVDPVQATGASPR